MTQEKFAESLAELLQQGFRIVFEDIINDVYTSIIPSPLGGNDVTRYRITERTGEVVEAIKIWEATSIPGTDKRVEIERNLDYAEYQAMNLTPLVSLRKHRTSLVGADGQHVDMDQFFVPEGFTPVQRFFIEVERIVYKEEDIEPTKSILRKFAQETLHLSEECRLSMVKLAQSYIK